MLVLGKNLIKNLRILHKKEGGGFLAGVYSRIVGVFSSVANLEEFVHLGSVSYEILLPLTGKESFKKEAKKL